MTSNFTNVWDSVNLIVIEPLLSFLLMVSLKLWHIESLRISIYHLKLYQLFKNSLNRIALNLVSKSKPSLRELILQIVLWLLFQFHLTQLIVRYILLVQVKLSMSLIKMPFCGVSRNSKETTNSLWALKFKLLHLKVKNNGTSLLFLLISK